MPKKDVTYKLSSLSTFMDQKTNLEENIQEITVKAAKILNVQNCSIMLLKDEENPDDITLRVFAHSGYLPAAANREAIKIKEGISGYIAATGESLFVEDIDKSQFASIKRGRYQSKGFIAAPIVIHDKIVGVINANTPVRRQNVNKKDLELLKVIALLISKSIQVIQLQNLLRSGYARFALAKEKKSQLLSISQDPGNAAKILAKTFYNEMSKAGFGPDHMIMTATEILSLLSEKKGKVKDDRYRFHG